MTRKKVKLAFIAKESCRKATFRKRKKGLVKKMTELSTLCDVDACAIIYSPYDDQPEVHPSPLGVARVLRRFRSVPDADRNRKKVDQEAFLRQRLVKLSDQLAKLRGDNRHKDATRLMFRALDSPGSAFRGLSLAGLRDLDCVVDQNLKEVRRQIERVAAAVKEEAPAAAAAAAEVMTDDAAAGRQQSFMDLMMSHQDDLALMGDSIYIVNGASQWGGRVFP